MELMMPIDHGHLARVDLNLLVCFDALLAERNVTRAAERIGITQSAMSHNLGRLRDLLRDELFVRTPRGMEPTPRARALSAFVGAVLAEVQSHLLDRQEFDPATAQRAFRIGVPDNLETLLMPPLLDAFRCEAPGLAVRVRSVDRFQALEALERNEMDLGIGRFRDGTTLHKRRVLFPEGFLVLYNPARVRVCEPITLEEYVALPHALASLREDLRGVADDALEALGHTRRVVLSTPHFLAIPAIIKASGTIATLPAAFARSAARSLGLATSPVPFELPGFQVSMLWHASYDRDPAHRWLRDKVAACMRQILTDSGSSPVA
jgi:DNA-binding transcriptional LysR family regulator